MTLSPNATQTSCAQCGAELAVEHGALYATCAFCGTTSFVDMDSGRFPLRPTRDSEQG